MKTGGIVSYVIFIVLCTRIMHVSGLTSMEKEGIEAYIVEKEKIEKRAALLFIKNKLYVRSMKSVEGSSNRICATLTTYREDSVSLGKRKWKKEMDLLFHMIGSDNDFIIISVLILYKKINVPEEVYERKEYKRLEDEVQNRALDIFAEIGRQDLQKEECIGRIVKDAIERRAHEIIRRITKEESKSVEFLCFLQYIAEKLGNIDPNIALKFEIPSEIYFFCKIEDFFSLLKQELTCKKFCVVFTPYFSLLYHIEKKKIYKIETREIPSSTSLQVKFNKEKYSLIQRREDTKHIFRHIKKAEENKEKEYLPLNLDVIRGKAKKPLLFGKYALTSLSRFFFSSAYNSEKESLDMFLEDKYNKYSILHISCVFKKDERGNAVLKKISVYLDIVKPLVVFLTAEEENTDQKEKREEGASKREPEGESVCQREPEGESVHQENLPKCFTIKELEIYYWNYGAQISIEKTASIKIEKLYINCEIVYYHAEKTGFDGSLLSLTKMWPSCDVLQFAIDPEVYIKYVIHETDFTSSVSKEKEKRKIILEDIARWNATKKSENGRLRLFSVTRADIKREEERLARQKEKNDNPEQGTLTRVCRSLFKRK